MKAFLNDISRVCRRELGRVRRRPKYLALLTLTLAFFYLFFFTLMREGQPESLPIGIVDNDGSYISRRLAHEIHATQGVDVVKIYDSHAEARADMQSQKIYAFLEIPKGTYNDVLNFTAPHLSLYSNNVYMLPGNLSYKSLSTISRLAAGAVQREVMRKKGYGEEQIMGLIQPVEMDVHCISNPTASYLPYILPTLLQGVLGVMVLLLTVYEVRRERKEGTEKEWLAAAGGSVHAALLGKLLPYTLYFSLLGIAGNLAMFGFAKFALLGGFGELCLMLALFVMAQQAMALLICGAVREMHLAVCVAAIYGMLAFTMSGFSFPVGSMPAWIQALSIIFPLRQYYLLYVQIALYGCGLAYYWPHLLLLVGYQAMGLAGAMLIGREYATPNSECSREIESVVPAIAAYRHDLGFGERIAGFLKDLWSVFAFEVQRIFHDSGVLLLFFVASLLYPILFACIYGNECVRGVPVAVVDECNSSDTKRMIRKLDATPELSVDYRCCTMAEAERLMKRMDVHGVVYFPRDYSARMARNETARMALFCDMGSFLYYRAVYTGASMAMVDEMKEVELCRYSAGGLTGEAANVQAAPIDFDDVKLYNPAGGFESFLVPALLVLVVFQTFFLGVCVLTGTANERKYKDIYTEPDTSHRGIFGRLHRNNSDRIVLGRALTYVVLYVPVVAVDLFLFPRLFGLPHIGQPGTLVLFLLPFLLSSIFFFLTIGSLARERDSGILVFIVFSLVLLFSSGIVWPQGNMPALWRWFGYLFPSTHGMNGFVRINSMGATLQDVRFEYVMLWCQTAVYFLTAYLVRDKGKRIRQRTETFAKTNF